MNLDEIIMSTADLKLDLISKITALNDAAIIRTLQKTLDFELDKDVLLLNDAQKERISKAHNDEVISDEQGNTDLAQWLQDK
ncbi:hypothetical protein FIC_00593 [Flavobacteriaceae bacterium 3519-10]|nr:hypothetical protein FIC_00593 [Flavobacteriaceae bacterium 3519-10]